MKKIYLILLIIVLAIFEFITILYSYHQPEKKIVTNDYIAVFKGEDGETVHSTYIYLKKTNKKTNKKKKYYYINTISKTSGYDSTNWQEEILKRGDLKKNKKIFEIAKKNNAYSYVKYEDGKIYSIDEFKKMFK